MPLGHNLDTDWRSLIVKFLPKLLGLLVKFTPGFAVLILLEVALCSRFRLDRRGYGDGWIIDQVVEVCCAGCICGRMIRPGI